MWQKYSRDSPRCEWLVKITQCWGQGPRGSSSCQLHELQRVPRASPAPVRGVCLSRVAPNVALTGFVGEAVHPGLHKTQRRRAAGTKVIPIRQEVYLEAAFVHSSLSTAAPAFLGELKVTPVETLALHPADVGKHFSALLRDEPEHQLRLQLTQLALG